MRLHLSHALCVLAFAGLLVAGHAATPSEAPIVGSKDFTESIILGELLRLEASRQGLKLDHRRAMGGSAILWRALRAGSIDAYPEYTGTLTQELLAQLPHPVSPEALTQALRELGLAMSAPLGFEDSYALGVPEALAQRLDLRTISDLAAHSTLRFALSNEFMSRTDGWSGMHAAYGLSPATVRGLDHSLAYHALGQGVADVIDVYTTDPQIDTEHIRLLDDDRNFFPSYQAVWLYRLESARRWPALESSIQALTGHVSLSVMRSLNAQVQFQRRPESAVAAQFLSTTSPPEQGWAQRLAQRTGEHLALVGVSLGLALALGLPLGVAAAKAPKFGRGVLALTVVLQTIPSLAMLVFMIPLLGIGALPAIATLFLYSLLPIVRNTMVGLSSLPAELITSAASLGLPWQVQLLRIELPLAGRTILAGISTAAVINVGTATLGALIGAGGYGEPILTGIRLNDVPLILEGAVPAAVMALLVMGLFQWLEHLVTPRGLRLRIDA
jgi:osmoprotectant transport system permease protein